LIDPSIIGSRSHGCEARAAAHASLAPARRNRDQQA
jgi:hypothetical protein